MRMTAVMTKADTKPARRGSNVGDSWTIVAGKDTVKLQVPSLTICTLSGHSLSPV